MAVLLEYGLLSIFREAGWPIWPLLATSVLGLALIFERMLSLRRGHVLPNGLTDQAIEMLRTRQDTPDALHTLERHSPLGRILAEVMRHRHLPSQALRMSVEDTGRAIAHELNRYIPAMIAHRWLRSRIDNYLHLMEQAAARLIRANAAYAEARA